jgi:hypothetical protein
MSATTVIRAPAVVISDPVALLTAESAIRARVEADLRAGRVPSPAVIDLCRCLTNVVEELLSADRNPTSTERIPRAAAPRMMNTKQVAKALNTTVRNITARANRGSLPGVMVDGCWQFPAHEIERRSA